jgi:hypothetical protein
VPVESDLVEDDRLAAVGLHAMGLALARLEALERLAALTGGGELAAALLELGVGAIELQRSLLLGAVHALEPRLRGDEVRTRSRRRLRHRLLASRGRALLRVGKQRDATRTNRKARRERLAGTILLVSAHFAHALQGEGE